MCALPLFLQPALHFCKNPGARCCLIQAVSCVAQQKPSFTYTGPTQPGWGYASPLGLAVVWFSADETLAPGTSAGSYLTSPGLLIVRFLVIFLCMLLLWSG